jgi:oligopeptide/dipeptide ABC transporter ATP-binding protein
MEPLLQVQHLKIYYSTAYGVFKAIDDVSFTLKKEETFCLIGESGCGKSTTALSIMRMLGDHARIEGGRILLENVDLLQLGKKELKQIWGKKIFIIFQDPMTSLNPVMKISNQIREVLIRKENKPLRKREVMERGMELLKQVDISDPKRVMDQFPHQLSGGMKQRVMIAMGVCLNPSLLILDEPTTALDSTIQFKIIELIRNLKTERKMSQILITHDFGVAAKLSDRIAVMYAGKIVEQGRYLVLLKEPVHPYTQGLFKSIVKPESKSAYLETMPGTLPNLSQLPKGCYFESRCKISKSICREHEPPLRDLGNEHLVACHQIDSE